MAEIINTITPFLHQHRYIFAFLGALFEGNYIMILAGVLFKFGYFNFSGLMAVLLSGYFLNGISWYLIGQFGGRRILEKWGNRLHVTRKLIKKLERYFKKHSAKTLFLIRITYGLNWPILIIAGSFKMKWKKFLIVSFLATVVWVIVTFGLGYVFGVSYKALGEITRSIAIGLTIVLFIIIVLISILIVYWLRKFAKTRFIKGLESNRFQFLQRLGGVINNLFNKNG